jgi:DNA/RNA endonuclease YhcR with UshA esterase domain
MRIIAVLLMVAFFSACLGQGDTTSATIQEILSNQNEYLDQEVVISGVTVEDIVFFQQGKVLLRMVDSSGARLPGIYTGDLYTVNKGDSATIGGIIKSESALGGAHLGAPIVMEITSIKDVVIGGGASGAPPSPAGTTVPENPTIGQILDNAVFFENQMVTVKGRVTDIKEVSHSDNPLSYLQLDDGTGKIWVAMPQAQVSLGMEVTVSGSIILNFMTPTIGGVLDVMLLSEGISGSSPSPHDIQPQTQKTITVEPGEVEKAQGGYTIEELFTDRQTLDGQEVLVRGKVVKISGEITVEGVEGTFWFHIQDGTGDPDQGTHDLTVTYSGSPPLNTGDVVLVKGVLGADVDLPAGYHFDVLVSGATVEK